MPETSKQHKHSNSIVFIIAHVKKNHMKVTSEGDLLYCVAVGDVQWGHCGQICTTEQNITVASCPWCHDTVMSVMSRHSNIHDETVLHHFHTRPVVKYWLLWYNCLWCDEPFSCDHHSVSLHSKWTIFREPFDWGFSTLCQPPSALSFPSKQKSPHFQLERDHEMHFACIFSPHLILLNKEKLLERKDRRMFSCNRNDWSKEEKTENHRWFDRFLFSLFMREGFCSRAWGWTTHRTPPAREWWQPVVQGKKVFPHHSWARIVIGNWRNKQGILGGWAGLAGTRGWKDSWFFSGRCDCRYFCSWQGTEAH